MNLLMAFLSGMTIVIGVYGTYCDGYSPIYILGMLWGSSLMGYLFAKGGIENGQP